MLLLFRSIWTILTASDAGFLTRFLRNLLVSALVLVVVLILQNKNLLQGAEDQAFDMTLKAKAFVAEIQSGAGMPSNAIEGAHGIYLVDIDQASHLAWNEPIHTPRNHIAAMLEKSAAAKPQAIVLDILLDQAGVNSLHDQMIVNFLSQYGKDCREGCPPIFIAKSLRQNPAETMPSWRASRIPGLDQAVAENELVRWVSPYQEYSSDNVVRHWRLSQCYKSDTGSLKAMLSFQLATCLARTSTTQNFAANYNKAETTLGQSCLQNQAPSVEPICTGAGGPIMVSDEVKDRRIAFQLHQHFNKQFMPLYNSPLITYGGQSAPALLSVPAHRFANTDVKVSNPLVSNQVILIGQSHEDSTDWHKTPAGNMSGVLVVANTIHSLWYIGETRPASPFISFAILAFGIFLISLLFLMVDSFFVTIIASTTIFLVLLPISWVLLSQGIWLDFAIPLLMVQIMEYVIKMFGAERVRQGD